MTSSKRTVLITGAEGFIGSHLSTFLKEKCDLVLTFYGAKPPNHNNVAYLDITKPDPVRETIRQFSPDIIIHLAGNKSLNYCEDHPDFACELNYRFNFKIIQKPDTSMPKEKMFPVNLLRNSCDFLIKLNNILTNQRRYL